MNGRADMLERPFCLGPTAKGPNNYLSCSCSVHFVNLLLWYTSGLNLAADLGPVLALFITCFTLYLQVCAMSHCRGWRQA